MKNSTGKWKTETMHLKNEYYTNALKMAMGTISSHVFWALLLLASARLYTPDYFGEWQLFISVASILSTIATGQYDAAIVVPRYRFIAVQILLFSVGISFFSAVVFSLIILGISETMINLTGIAESEILLIPIYMLELCLCSLFQLFLVREKMYTTVSKGMAFFPAVCLILCVVFQRIALPVHKLMLAIILARIIQVLYYGASLYGILRKILQKISWKSVLKCGKSYADFPLYMLGGGAVDAMAYHLIPFFLVTFWGKAAVGYYSMASQVLAAPASLIAKSVGNVFQQEAGRLYGKYKECKALYLNNFRLCLAYSAVICIGAFIILPMLLPILMGDKWIMAGYYVQLMLPMTFVTLVSSTLSHMYIVARRQRTYLGIQTAKFFGSVVSLGIAGAVGVSVENSLFIWGCVMAFISGVGIYGGIRIALGK